MLNTRKATAFFNGIVLQGVSYPGGTDADGSVEPTRVTLFQASRKEDKAAHAYPRFAQFK